MTSGDKPWFANPLLHHRVTDLFSSFPTDTPPPPAAPNRTPPRPTPTKHVRTGLRPTRRCAG